MTVVNGPTWSNDGGQSKSAPAGRTGRRSTGTQRERAHVLEEEFHAAVMEAVRETGRPVEELDRVGHAPDHPATFDEAKYLKAVYLRFLE